MCLIFIDIDICVFGMYYKEKIVMLENLFTPEPLRFIIIDKTHILVSKKYTEQDGNTITLPQYKLEADLSDPKLAWWYPIMARQMIQQLLGLTSIEPVIHINKDQPDEIKTFLITVESLGFYEKNSLSARIRANAHYLLTKEYEKHLLERLHLYNHKADPPKSRVSSVKKKKVKV